MGCPPLPLNLNSEGVRMFSLGPWTEVPRDMPALPSDAELEILRVLWRIGPARVREVHERLPRRSEVVYNTVGKLLRIMEQKGLVACDDSVRAHVFRPLVEAEATRSRLIHDLADRAFGGSSTALALHALGNGKLSDAEIAELTALLVELEE